MPPNCSRLTTRTGRSSRRSRLAERCGVNAIMLVNAQFPLFRKYIELVSGKMQTICQCFPNLKDIKTDIDKAIDNGATTIYVQGGMADRFVLNQES